MVSSPSLYRLAANREYESIPARVATHPEDITWTDRYGSTCLHILCQARTNVDDALLRAVQSIVLHRPDVVAWANVATWTPLHFAVEKRFDCAGTAIPTPTNTSTTTTTTTIRYNYSNSTNSRYTYTSNNDSRYNYSSNNSSLYNYNHNTSGRRNIMSPSQYSSNQIHNINNSPSVAVTSVESVTISNNNSNNKSKRGCRNWSDDDSATLSTCTRLVLQLIEACPHAVSVRTKSGFKTKTPFHIACEADADYRILRAMLQINPGLATQPFIQSSDVYAAPAENPLQLLWKNHHWNGYPTRSSSSSSSGKRCSSCSASPDLMNKMALLLRAAHYWTVQHFRPSQQSFRLLNAACSVRCPKDYVALVLKQNAKQIVEKDEKGLLPLHYAVQNACLDSQTYTQFIVDALLVVYPQAAAATDEHGRLPLHVACEVGLTWHKGGVQELTLKYPNALRTFDPQTGLVPFLQSACHAIHSKLHLSTTLELLLAAPEMVQPWKCKHGQNPKPEVVDETVAVKRELGALL